MRNRLARYRALTVADALETHGVAAARIVTTPNAPTAEAGPEQRVLVPLVLGTVTTP